MNKNTASWIIVDKTTNVALFETYLESTAKRINTAKYVAIPVLDYLVDLNREIKETSKTTKPCKHGYWLKDGKCKPNVCN